MARMALVATLATLSTASSPVPVTVVGPWTYMGGPVDYIFDSPFLSLNASGVVRGYSANQETYLLTSGDSVNAQLPQPVYTQLGADSENSSSLDHCGAWLNGAWVDSSTPGLVHGYYHQEWRCDYAHDFYTNKSIGYAVSTDGGANFTKPGHPSNAIITCPNSTTSQQTGEGDHGVLAWPDGFLYLFYLEWNAPHGDVTISVARAAQSSGGVPGAWFKYLNGSFTSPGVGGDSDMLHDIPGTAVYALNATGQALSFGNFLPAVPGQITLAVSDDLIHWTQAAVPVMYSEPSSWNRTGQSNGLLAYPALTSDGGGYALGANNYATATYFPPFSGVRYLYRRTLDLYASVTGADGSLVPPALVALSGYTNTPAGLHWDTSNVVLPASNYTLVSSVIGYVTSSNNTAAWAPGVALPSMVTLYDCTLSVSPAGLEAHMVAMEGECSTLGGVYQSHIGFVWSAPPVPSAAAAAAAPQLRASALPTGVTSAVLLQRCTAAVPGGGVDYFVVSTNVTSCAAQGGAVNATLGYAYGPVA